MPTANSCPSWFKSTTESPRLNAPRTSLIPDGSKLLPPLTIALSAPGSIVICPLGAFVKAIQRFRLHRVTSWGRKRVPTSSPLKMLCTTPGLKPLAMMVGTPPRETAWAALILLPIPPVPRKPGIEPAYWVISRFTRLTTGISRAFL